MDFLKGLFSDSRPQGQPAGTIPFGKNGLSGLTKGTLENEPGFLPSSASIPYQPIGIVETDRFPVVISTNNVNSAIGYFNDDTDTYTPIYNDISLPFKFGFTIDHYVTGEAQRNHKGEVVIAITDKNVYPLYVNCDAPTAATLEELYLDPRATAPLILTDQDQGGALAPGSYYILARYLKRDGTMTSFLSISDVTIIKGSPGTLTDRAITITINNIDPAYDEVQLAIISKTGGVAKPVTLTPSPVSGGSMTQVYSGAEITEDITLEEVLINPVSYKRIGSFGQLNDMLYALNLEKEPEINMQKYTNLAKLHWKSELVSVVPSTPAHITGKKRHFPHQEVFCFCLQYSLVYGGWSRYFIIPGTVPVGGDTILSAETGAELLGATGSVPKYKVEDTIHSFNLADKTGEMGVWVNENETYPNTTDYDSSSIGGLDLRGQQVRHHRFPSVPWCKTNLYPGDPEYGRTKLDLLGVRVSNVIIPSELQGIVTGWRLVYAKRTIANSTVLGQSVLLHASRAENSQVDTDYISTGGNWNAKMDFQNTSNDRPLAIDKSTFRFHSFDMLFNQPSVTPSYIAPLLKLSRPNLAYDGGLIEDYSITPDEKNGPIVYLIDYTQKGTTPLIAASGKRIRKIAQAEYVPVNVISGKWKNLQQETVFGGKLADTREILTDAELSFSNLWVGPGYERPDKAAQFETTYLTNLMALRSDIARPFTSQTMVSAGQRVIGATGDFFGGDSFLNDYAFHTYGWNDSENRGYGGELGGIKVARRFICEAVSNINLRYEVPGNIYSKWYPNSPLIPQDPTNYILAFNRKLDPNQFGYSKDLSGVNEFISGTVFDPTKEDISKFPYRVHRYGKLSRQDKRRSWRTALPLDYYEMPKNMGFGVNIEGYNDRLIIHHENAMFVTQDKARLESGILSVTLGAGDIFQFEPQEEVPSKLGYAGTQHDLACVKTPMGYVFIDSKQGQLFIYTGKLQLANNGLDNFFREFLRVMGNNPFNGNGYTIGYDPEYKRLLVTAKNQSISGPVIPDYTPTQAFIDTLHVGDVVYKNGRFQKFLGVNATEYACGDIPNPVTSSMYEFSIPEDTPVGTRVFTITGSNVADYFFVLSDGTFTIQGDGIYLSRSLDYESQNLYNINGIALNTAGEEDDFLVRIHITNVVAEPPTAQDGSVEINENLPNSSTVFQVIATDPQSLPLTYTITSGNLSGAFAINSSTGLITVAASSQLDYEKYPLGFLLKVTVSNGTNTDIAEIRVKLLNVDEPVEAGNVTLRVVTGMEPGVIGVIPAIDPEGGPVVFQTLTESTSGLFTVGATTGVVTINDPGALNPATTPLHTLGIRAVDEVNHTTDLTLTILVDYALGNITFEPFGGICTDPSL